MSSVRVLVFEDSNVDQLDPITTGRPAFAVTCAGYRLIDWLERLQAPMTAAVRRRVRVLR